MKSVCFVLITAAALAGCSAPPPPPEVHHHYYHSTTESAPGAPIHLENPGEPDSFKVQGASQ